MTQRTRYFLLGSSLVLIVGLCTGLVAYYNGSLPLRASSVGPAELAYVPAGTTAVAFADVRQVMNSDFRKRLKQVMPTGEEKDKIQNEMGVDIERDIDTVVAGWTGTSADAKTGIVLIRGRFNQQQIESVAVQHGGVVQQYAGKKLISFKKDDQTSGTADDQTGVVAFIEPGLLACGNLGSVKAALDSATSGQNITKNSDVMKLVAELQTGSTAWAVGHVEGLPAGNLPQQAKDQLANIQWFTASLHVDGGVNGVLKAVARDDQAAENLRDVVRGGLAAAHLMAGRDTRLDTVVNSVQVAGMGKDVTVTFNVPVEILDMLNGIAGMHNLQNNNSGGAIKK